MSVKRKRVVVTLKDKLDALTHLDEGVSVVEIANALGVGCSTVKDWKKNRKELEAASLQISTVESLSLRRTLRKPVLEVLDEALWLWFMQERRRGAPLSGPILKEKALVLHRRLQPEKDFTASEGWLNRWKKRHGVRQTVISGERLFSSESAHPHLMQNLKTAINNDHLVPEQLYSASETGLNFKLLPQKMLGRSREQGSVNLKKGQERVTVLVCGNAAGTHKLPLCVVGNSKQPRAFKNVNQSTLPVYYRAQKASWMSADLLEDWFRNEFVPLATERLISINLPPKAILILNNASSQHSVEVLQHGEIKAYFLPSNISALAQPTDQGVVESLKRRYRKKLLSSLLEKLDPDTDARVSVIEAVKKINIKDFIYMIARAWDEIPPPVLGKSWSRVLPELGNPQCDENNLEMEFDNSILMVELNELEGEDKSQENDVKNWIRGDCEQENEMLDDDAIIEAVTQKPENDLTSSDEDDDDENEVIPKISHCTAKECLDKIIQYVEQQQSASSMDTLLLRKWRDYAAERQIRTVKQKKMRRAHRTKK